MDTIKNIAKVHTYYSAAFCADNEVWFMIKKGKKVILQTILESDGLENMVVVKNINELEKIVNSIMLDKKNVDKSISAIEVMYGNAAYDSFNDEYTFATNKYKRLNLCDLNTNGSKKKLKKLKI